MTISRLVTLFSLIISFNAFAQAEDRPFFFRLGEKVMNLSGFSYLELEKKLATSDNGLSECLTENSQLKFQQEKKDQELMACKGATEAPVDAAAGAEAGGEAAPAAP